SYGSLKEIAGVLTENANLKVQVVGHTDSDGDDAANMDLSKRRAASVKNALVSEFKIDAARLDTDGKGETQPIDKNDTPAGKANNRRVEFIKKEASVPQPVLFGCYSVPRVKTTPARKRDSLLLRPDVRMMR